MQDYGRDHKAQDPYNKGFPQLPQQQPQQPYPPGYEPQQQDYTRAAPVAETVASMPQGNGPRLYKLSKGRLSRHYDWHNEKPTGNEIATDFTVDISKFSRNKPNFVLKPGTSTKDPGPILACVHLGHISRTFRMGIGDPQHGPCMWEEVAPKRYGSSEYNWTTPIPGTSERLPVTWKSTRHVAVDGMKATFLSDKDWKLVDQQGGVLAVFTHKTRLSLCGYLQINADFGPEFDYACIMCVSTLYDFERSRGNSAAPGAGGGGGGE